MQTARVNWEEGGDDVKSSCPLHPGLHTYYNGRYKGQRYREVERIPKNVSQSGLQSATRLHEVGIASNLEVSIRRVNAFPGLVHTARHTTRNGVLPEAGGPTSNRGSRLR